LECVAATTPLDYWAAIHAASIISIGQIPLALSSNAVLLATNAWKIAHAEGVLGLFPLPRRAAYEGKVTWRDGHVNNLRRRRTRECGALNS